MQNAIVFLRFKDKNLHETLLRLKSDKKRPILLQKINRNVTARSISANYLCSMLQIIRSGSVSRILCLVLLALFSFKTSEITFLFLSDSDVKLTRNYDAPGKVECEEEKGFDQLGKKLAPVAVCDLATLPLSQEAKRLDISSEDFSYRLEDFGSVPSPPPDPGF